MQRQSVMARWAKSRHTPCFSWKGVISGFGRVGVRVAESDALVHVVADRLHQRPALRHLAEGCPGELAETIGFAIAAAEEVTERLHRELLQRDLLRIRCHLVMRAAVLDKK